MKKSIVAVILVLVLINLVAAMVMLTGGQPVDDPGGEVATVGDAVYRAASDGEQGTAVSEQVYADETANTEAGVPNSGGSSEDSVSGGSAGKPRTRGERVEVKGIYATGYTAGSSSVNRLIDLIDTTELNALVVDIKDATGYLTTPLQYESELSVKAATYKIRDLDGLMQRLKQHGIYSIARIVVFKDPLLAQKHPDLAVHSKSGGLWKDYKGMAWANPYRREVWDYNLAIAAAAAGAGFDEIQFDYVRFPSDGPMKEMVFPAAGDINKEDAIAQFLAYAREQLADEGVYLSADVFGLTTSAADDLGIGQKIELIAANTDYVSPMVYPSHYAPGTYGITNPNGSPYRTVYRSLSDAVYKLSGVDNIIRPWLQDFTYGYPYGAAEVKAQFKATYDAGLKEWILWNPSNRYTASALEKE